MRYKTIIAGVIHRGIQEAVDDQRPRLLVELVFDGPATFRDLDDDVDVVGRRAADRDFCNVHDAKLQIR
jgi:hypothetical protein